MFSLLQSEPNWTIKPKEPPLATTKPPQPEDDIGLEYLSTDAIYQLLYRSETQTDKGILLLLLLLLYITVILQIVIVALLHPQFDKLP